MHSSRDDSSGSEDDGWRFEYHGQGAHPRIPFLGGAGAAALLATALLMLTGVLGPAGRAGPPAEAEAVRPETLRGAPARQYAVLGQSWLMCSSTGACNQQGIMRRWAQDPAGLAARAGSFGSVPGIPAAAYAPVAQRWGRNAPSFRGRPVALTDIAYFVQQLLGSDPFGTGTQVPYVDFNSGKGAKVVAITQKQIAFLVANVLMGNHIGGGDGLSHAIGVCSSKRGGPQGQAFVYSLLSLLAVLSRELGDGGQGRMLVAATPREADDSWREELGRQRLKAPTICDQTGAAPACADFMAGGTKFQALTDIAGVVVGGGAQLCDIANSQDESAVQFYSEVLAFAFFAGGGAGGGQEMLPVPWALLGARRYMSTLTGESMGPQEPFSSKCGFVGANNYTVGYNWLNEEISAATTNVRLGGSVVGVAPSAFVAVASKSSAASHACPLYAMESNQCDSQRRHYDEDIRLWYQGFSSTMYLPEVQEAFNSVIRRVGTGPWGAGVWYGDSQQYFLATWLAQSLIPGAALDYYIYHTFCENPGNQCFVLGSRGCAACMASSRGKAQSIQPGHCGAASVWQMAQKFTGRTAWELYLALRDVGPPPTQVFDLLARYSADPAELASPPRAASPVPQPSPPQVLAPSPAASGPAPSPWDGHGGGDVQQPSAPVVQPAWPPPPETPLKKLQMLLPRLAKLITGAQPR